jgi:hypothetical protein
MMPFIILILIFTFPAHAQIAAEIKTSATVTVDQIIDVEMCLENNLEYCDQLVEYINPEIT